MRNEQRHGLEQHEIDEYNKLVNILDHQWDYITGTFSVTFLGQDEEATYNN